MANPNDDLDEIDIDELEALESSLDDLGDSSLIDELDGSFKSDDEDEEKPEDEHDEEEKEEVEEEEEEKEVDAEEEEVKIRKKGRGDDYFTISSQTFALANHRNNPNLPKNYYFDNTYVEQLLTEYVKGGCTDIDLRDKIMSNAAELIRQIIRTHKLHTLGHGKEGSTFGDLFQIAWVQLESSLYKFDYRPGHTKVFNMWCVSPNTLIMTDTGIKKIGDCVPYGSGFIDYNLEVFGLNGRNKVSAYARRAKSNTIKITLDNGLQLECTPEHKVLSFKNESQQWVSASDLKLGSVMFVQSGQQCFGLNQSDDPYQLGIDVLNGCVEFDVVFELDRNNTIKFIDGLLSDSIISTRNCIFRHENRDLLIKLLLLMLNFGVSAKVVDNCIFYDGVCFRDSLNNLDFKLKQQPAHILRLELSESETIDIEVPATRSFTANGMIVSNSQVAKTVMLAHIKKESRDRRNYGAYKDHLDAKRGALTSQRIDRFIDEAKKIHQFNSNYLKILDALSYLAKTDDKLHDGLIDKLSQRSGIQRAKVSAFLRSIRLMSFEFTDAPVNEEYEKSESKHRMAGNFDDED